MFRISRGEVCQRPERLLAEVGRRGCEGACLFGPVEVFYFSGFSFLPTERPVGLVLTRARVDEAVSRYFAQNGLEDYWRHHTGHAPHILSPRPGQPGVRGVAHHGRLTTP
ncbi:MAG: hypothetical protein H5U04_06935 [Firmicutes bacterium]|nr:hypothetical protein [Bacillota bacterium]